MAAAAGNEGNVEGYANVTGLMWENAERFGALLLFAEVGGPTSGLIEPTWSSKMPFSHDTLCANKERIGSVGAHAIVGLV